MRLIAEALGLCSQVLGLIGRNTTVVDVYSHPFLEHFDVRDKGWITRQGQSERPKPDPRHAHQVS